MLYILQHMLHVIIHVSVRYTVSCHTCHVHITTHASCYNTCVRSILILVVNTRYTYYNTCFMLQYMCPFDTQLVAIHVMHITTHASCYNTCVRSILILFQYMLYIFVRRMCDISLHYITYSSCYLQLIYLLKSHFILKLNCTPQRCCTHEQHITETYINRNTIKYMNDA